MGGRADFLDGPIRPERPATRNESPSSDGGTGDGGKQVGGERGLLEHGVLERGVIDRGARSVTSGGSASSGSIGNGHSNHTGRAAPTSTPTPNGPRTEGVGRVLVVVDDRELGTAIEQALRLSGCVVDAVASSDDPFGRALGEEFDLVVAQLELTSASGLELVQRVHRERPSVRQIVLTTRGDEDTRIEVIASGADDVLSPPHSPREVAARAKAQLRRLDLAASDRIHVEEGLVVDLGRLQVERGGRAYDLTPLEAGILGFVLRHGHRVVSRDEILAAVWGSPESQACARTVDVHIVALRRKLHGASGSQRLIRTVRGLGYRWCG